MPVIAGKAGTVGVGASNYTFSSWTLDMKTDAVDTTSFDDGGYKTNVAGLTGATISARGPYNVSSTAMSAGTTYSFNLRVNSTVGFTMTARVTSLRVVTDVSRAVELEIAAESTGSFSASIT